MLNELRDRLGRLNAEARSIIDAADERKTQGGEGLTAEESAKVDSLYEEFDVAKEKHDAEERLAGYKSRVAEAEAFLSDSPGVRSAPDHPGDFVGNASTAPSEFVFKYRNEEIVIGAGEPGYELCSQQYRGAFSDYLMTGRMSEALQTSDDTDGGYLAPRQMSMQMIMFLDDEVFMRSLATVLPPLTTGVSLGAPSLDADPADADWTSEVPASAMTADTTMAFGKRELAPHLCAKYIEVSRKLLRAAAISVESLVTSRLAYKFAITEEKAFLTGNGSQRPLGVFTASADGVSTSRDVDSSGAAIVADDLIDTLFSLKGQYMNRATWILHRDILKLIRKLKDGNNQYVWHAGLDSGASTNVVSNMAGTILDRPYMMSEYAPNTVSNGLYTLICGDFSQYWIVDSLGFEVQRLNELKALQNLVGFVGRKETDGMPVLEEAFARLKMSA